MGTIYGPGVASGAIGNPLQAPRQSPLGTIFGPVLVSGAEGLPLQGPQQSPGKILEG